MRGFNFFLVNAFLFFLSQELISDIMVINMEGGIGPSKTYYLKNSLQECKENKYKALIIKLNTPGGLLDATREMTGIIMSSAVPVIVYVSPIGARAGSAGVFITMSGHIAAMAPGTNIGAAHPVGLGGNADSSVMGQKVENDAAAYARSIAEKRGRNVVWAESAVRQSVSVTENEALNENIIDIIANNINDLVNQCNGKVVKVGDKEIKLDFRQEILIIREMNWKERFLDVISNPNIAYILIMIGLYGLFFELKSPGSIFPGAVGITSLLIAAYSLQMMPVNYIGLSFIILGFLLFILEIFVVSYGFLSIGGVVSLILGSIMLIDSPLEFMRVSMELIITFSVLSLAFAGLIIYLGIKAQKVNKSTGQYKIIGLEGIAKTDLGTNYLGKVLVNGELWQASTDEEIKKGEQIIVEQINSMVLKVRKKIKSPI